MHKIDTRANVIISQAGYIFHKGQSQRKRQIASIFYTLARIRVIYTGLIGPRQATDLTESSQSEFFQSIYFKYSNGKNHQASRFPCCHTCAEPAFIPYGEISTAAREQSPPAK